MSRGGRVEERGSLRQKTAQIQIPLDCALGESLSQGPSWILRDDFHFATSSPVWGVKSSRFIIPSGGLIYEGGREAEDYNLFAKSCELCSS